MLDEVLGEDLQDAASAKKEPYTKPKRSAAKSRAKVHGEEGSAPSAAAASAPLVAPSAAAASAPPEATSGAPAKNPLLPPLPPKNELPPPSSGMVNAFHNGLAVADSSIKKYFESLDKLPGTQRKTHPTIGPFISILFVSSIQTHQAEARTRTCTSGSAFWSSARQANLLPAASLRW